MSTPIPVPAAPSLTLGQQLLATLKQDVVDPGHALLTALGAASGDPLKDGAALASLAGSLPADGFQLLSDEQATLIRWATQRFTAWERRQVAVPNPAPSP